MKETAYKCKKCGKTCNGGGVSFTVVQAAGKAAIVMSADMDELPEHGCTEEHILQIFGDIVRKIKGGDAGTSSAPGAASTVQVIERSAA